MKLSLWILKEELKEYKSDIKCNDSKTEIEEVRLADNSSFKPGIIYVGTSDHFFHDNKNDVICFHKKDYLRLYTDDIFTVMNRILSVFGHFARWADQCLSLISSGCTLSELLTLGEYIFMNPIYIVDASQFLIARSTINDNISYPDSWSNLMENRTLPEEKLKQFNITYQDTFTQTGVFYLPQNYFPTSSYCKHIFIDGERFATVVLAEQKPLPEKSTRHLLELFTPFIERWIQNNLAEDSSYNTTSHFARYLDGNSEALPVLQRRLSLFGWEEDCNKLIAVASVISEQFHFDAHLSRILTSEAEGVYAFPYKKKIVLLCNMDLIDREAFFEQFKHILKTNNYYAAVSFPFYKASVILKAFNQACLALADGRPDSGMIYDCKHIAMKYISGLFNLNDNAELLHPVVQLIKEYDKAHNSNYYMTLFTFLKNERNHRLTAEKLFIHRNTLFLRLNNIKSLWNLDLDDPDERFYLLFSFYQMEYSNHDHRLSRWFVLRL
ncbi:MAG: helix-turn-helix domain-containing protein [Parasporobacterium sp.]|nr:helix-turn-helix domain-containing protein [Parasporobacterium sp.]